MIGFRDDDEDEDSEGAYGIRMNSKPSPSSAVAKAAALDAKTNKYSFPKEVLDLVYALRAMSLSDKEVVDCLDGLGSSGSPFVNDETTTDDIGDEWGADVDAVEQFLAHKPPTRLGQKDWSKARRTDMIERMKLKDVGANLLRRCFALCSYIQQPSSTVPHLTISELDTLVDGMDMLLRFILLEPAPTPAPTGQQPLTPAELDLATNAAAVCRALISTANSLDVVRADANDLLLIHKVLIFLTQRAAPTTAASPPSPPKKGGRMSDL